LPDFITYLRQALIEYRLFRGHVYASVPTPANNRPWRTTRGGGAGVHAARRRKARIYGGVVVVVAESLATFSDPRAAQFARVYLRWPRSEEA